MQHRAPCLHQESAGRGIPRLAGCTCLRPSAPAAQPSLGWAAPLECSSRGKLDAMHLFVMEGEGDSDFVAH